MEETECLVCVVVIGRIITEGRKQKAEGRRQKAESRKQKAESRKQKAASCVSCNSCDSWIAFKQPPKNIHESHEIHETHEHKKAPRKRELPRGLLLIALGYSWSFKAALRRRRR